MSPVRVKKYDRHLREYTLVGISAAFMQFFTAAFSQLFGRTFAEIIVVIQDGKFYHFQRRGDRGNLSRAFLRQVNAGRVDLVTLRAVVINTLPKYRRLLALPTKKFSLGTLLAFYRAYRTLLAPAYASMDTIDFLETLRPSLRVTYRRWVTDLRRQTESVYKIGEMVFVPRFLRWLCRKHLPAYSPRQLRYVLYPEMRRYLQGVGNLPSVRELKFRAQCCYVRFTPGNRYQLRSGQSAARLIANKGLLDPRVLDQTITELRGQVAYPGRVVGKVRIVRLRSQMVGFKPHEILVTTMTDPTYLPIMKVAGGFVTNEGGMLSHAAIVARELKKPCIIGTKIAAHVMNNGDVIELDGRHGIIRILRRA